MDQKSHEQNRITLSIVFITAYLTILVGFQDKIKFPSSELSYFNDLIFGIFVLGGISIIISFFLFLVFSALELDFHKKKEIFFDQEVSIERVQKIKRFSYNLGVRLIFLSVSYPVYYLLAIFKQVYNFWITFTLWALCLALVTALVFILFKDKNLK